MIRLRARFRAWPSLGLLVTMITIWPCVVFARDLTINDVRRAWHQASYRAQIANAHRYYQRRTPCGVR